MQDKMDSLHENHTHELTELPKGKRALRNKWVYKLKPGDAGNPPRYKARIVVKGFQVPTEERSGFRRDLCPGSQDDIHLDGAKHCNKHGPRGRVARRQDGIPTRRSGRGHIHVPAGRLYDDGGGRSPHVLTKEMPLTA